MDSVRNVVEEDLPAPAKGERDRFDEPLMGVKRAFRPEWLDSENGIFINNLNYCAKNFAETHNQVTKLRNTVYESHKLRLNESELAIKKLQEEHGYTRSKLETMEENLPKMIREMIDYYTDTKLAPRLDEFVEKKEYNERVSLKLDQYVFNEYVKGIQQSEMCNDKEFKTDERLFLIEQSLNRMVPRDEMKTQLKLKVNNDKINGILNELHNLQATTVIAQDKQDGLIKKFDQTLSFKTSELEVRLSDMNIRVKRCEEELDDDVGGEDDENRQSGDPLELGSKQNSKANLTGFMESPSKYEKHSDGDGDSPNIGDIKNQNVLNNTASPLGVVAEAKAPPRMNRFAAEDAKLGQTQLGALKDSVAGSGLNLSKSSFRGDGLRKSRSKRKDYQSTIQGSIIGGSSSQTKKMKKRGSTGLDKEGKELIKNMEAKIEEVRKSAFQEINRIEMLLEHGNESNLDRLQQIQQKQEAECAQLFAQNNEVRNEQNDFKSVIHLLNKNVEKCRIDIKSNKEDNSEAKLNQLQRKLIREVVTEITTPMQRDFNVDFKQLRKILEECMNNIKDHQKRHTHCQKQINEMSTTLVRSLKNSDCDKTALNFELKRMQHLDRVKVSYANDRFYNPDISQHLPSIDTAYASCNLNEGHNRAQSTSQTPMKGGNLLDEGSRDDFISLLGSNQEIVTTQELKGHCERFNQKPSQRSRIIIARSQDPHMINAHSNSQQQNIMQSGLHTERPRLGNLGDKTMDQMNSTFHFQQDSKMSIQAGVKQDLLATSPSILENKALKGTQSAFDARDNLNSVRSGLKTINNSLNTGGQFNSPHHHHMMISTEQVQVPDAMDRIRKKNTDKKKLSQVKQRQMAEHLEVARGQVLDSYNIKTMLNN